MLSGELYANAQEEYEAFKASIQHFPPTKDEFSKLKELKKKANKLHKQYLKDVNWQDEEKEFLKTTLSKLDFVESYAIPVLAELCTNELIRNKFTSTSDEHEQLNILETLLFQEPGYLTQSLGPALGKITHSLALKMLEDSDDYWRNYINIHGIWYKKQKANNNTKSDPML